MLKSLVFVNNLKYTKGLDHPLTRAGEETLIIVSIETWVDLVNDYLKLKTVQYSIPDLWQCYLQGNIVANLHDDPLDVTYHDVQIKSRFTFGRGDIKYHKSWQERETYCPENPWILAHRYNDAGCYDRAQVRWIYYNDKRPLFRSVLLWSKDKVCMIHKTNPHGFVDYATKVRDAYYASFMFQKYLVEKENATEVYKILPYPQEVEGWVWLCTDRDGFSFRPTMESMPFQLNKRPLGDGLRISVPTDVLLATTPEQAKGIFI